MDKISDREYYDLKKVIELLLDEYRRTGDRDVKDKLKKVVIKLMTEYEQNRDTEYLIDMIKDKVTL